MADGYDTDGNGRTTVIEQRSGGAGMMIGMIVIIALIAAIAFFLFAKDNREERQTDAVVGAAQSVGDAARDAGAKIGDAADRVTPKN
ncbi:hypothetical protein BH10PSE13_BH10PSE13_08190 [soil metagenome]